MRGTLTPTQGEVGVIMRAIDSKGVGLVVEHRNDLARIRTFPRVAGRSWDEHLACLRSLTDSRSELERQLLSALADGHYRLPDEAQKLIAEPNCFLTSFNTPTFASFVMACFTTQRPRRRGTRKLGA